MYGGKLNEIASSFIVRIKANNEKRKAKGVKLKEMKKANKN